MAVHDNIGWFVNVVHVASIQTTTVVGCKPACFYSYTQNIGNDQQTLTLTVAAVSIYEYSTLSVCSGIVLYSFLVLLQIGPHYLTQHKLCLERH